MNVGELKKFKDNLYSALSRDLSEFEKNFLLIAAGLLAFSITFIKDIVKVDTASHLAVLFISWGLIAIAIGIMMFTLIFSSIASDELWKVVDDYMISISKSSDTDTLTAQEITTVKTKINDIYYQRKKSLKVKRILAIIFFLFGIVFFGLFVGINLLNENQKIKATSSTKKALDIKRTNEEVLITADSLQIKINDSLFILTK